MAITLESFVANTSSATVGFMAPGQNIKDGSWNDGLELMEYPGTEKIYRDVKVATEGKIDIEKICNKDAAGTSIVNPAEIQTAAFGIGYAHWNVLRRLGIEPSYLICFSSSEVLMSSISRSLTVKDGAKFAYKRGLEQQKVAETVGGGGVAVIFERPLYLKAAKRAIEDKTGMHFAGEITPLQSTFGYSGDTGDELTAELNNVKGVRRVIPVPNLHFGMHGPDMAPVKAALAHMYDSGAVRFRDAVYPHIATRTAQLNTKRHTIAQNLIWQTDHPVKLQDGITKADRLGVDVYFDLGPGDTMSEILERFPLNTQVLINPVPVLRRQVFKEYKQLRIT